MFNCQERNCGNPSYLRAYTKSIFKKHHIVCEAVLWKHENIVEYQYYTAMLSKGIPGTVHTQFNLLIHALVLNLETLARYRNTSERLWLQQNVNTLFLSPSTIYSTVVRQPHITYFSVFPTIRVGQWNQMTVQTPCINYSILFSLLPRTVQDLPD